jgi:hypothetical protein
MLTPYEKAKSLYDNPDDFYAVIEACGKHGVVHSDDEVFVCAYKIYSTSILKKSEKELDKPDTWFIYLLAGNPKRCFDLDKTLTYVCFERFDGNYRLIKTEKLKRRYGKL